MEKIFENLKNRGIKAWQEEGNLKFLGTKSNFSNDTIRYLSENKEKLLAYLQNESDKIKASQNQMALWLERKMGNTSGYIHNGILLQFSGKLNLENVKQAFEKTIEKHDALSCTFYEEEGNVYIKQNTVNDAFFYYLERRTSDAKEFVIDKMHETMDLFQGPLFQVVVCQYAHEAYYVAFWAHHIISDAYSLFLIEKDFYQYYNEFEHGHFCRDFIRMSGYLDSIKQEDVYLSGKQYQKELSFWKKYLDQNISGTSLPKYKINYQNKLYQPLTYKQKISEEHSERINKFAKKYQLTPYMLMFSIFNLGIHFMNENKENAIGLFAANRLEEKHLKEVGYFSNAVVYQDVLSSKVTFHEYIKSVKTKLIQLFMNQHVPFTSLVQELAPTRKSGMPFFNIAFDSLLFSKDEEKEKLQKELGFVECELIKGSGNYDIIIWLYEKEGCYELEYRYNSVYFDEYQIDSLASVLDSIIINMENEEMHVRDIPVLSGKYKMLVEQQNCTKKQIGNKSTYELFEEQVENNPEKIAIRFQDKKMSYGDVRKMAESVQRVLNKKQIGKGEYIGVLMQKSAELIPVILGIWASGAVYVPIDPNFPVKRQEYIIENTKLSAVMKDDTDWNITCKVKTILLDEVLKDNAEFSTNSSDLLKLEDPAYVLYTSGSTGNPKGVVISHKSLVNFLIDMRQRVGIKQTNTMLAITSICFDISILEMFLPIVNGSDVVLISYSDSKSGKRILETVESYQITFMQATPSTYEILYEYYKESGRTSYLFETCLCGGESYELNLVEKIQEMSKEVFNVYGPTETTIWSTVYKIPNPCNKLKIGGPIANTVIRIADSNGRELPVGVPGELMIGGKGVFLGYYNAQNLTNEVMVRISENTYFYRTGDWAYWNQNGELVFLGRKDSQIKIRGFRVEISEIENVFRKYEHISSVAVVTVKKNDIYILVAAITLKEKMSCTKEQIYEYISNSLPEYMRPEDIMFLDELPKTNNNKIDKKAIQQIAQDKILEAVEELKEELTESEKKVIALWNEVLQTNVSAIDKGFFEVGGDSLLLNKLTLKLQKEFEREIDIIALLTYNTVRKMAHYLNNEKIEEKLDKQTLKKAADRRSSFIKKRKGKTI